LTGPGTILRVSPRAILIWSALVIAITVPTAFAAASPYLAWRSAIYIVAGFAGVIGLGLLLVQPLMIGGYLPGPSASRARRLHRWIGGLLVTAVVVHVGGLYLTSPQDVIDVFLFQSPTPFSVWGVIALAAIFVAALLAVLRRRLRLRPRTWRISHSGLAVVIVAGTVVHAVLIVGTMETISKAVLCGLVVAATAKVIADLRLWSNRAATR
jgi:predicted ferric reductase